jgi:hypothetical protein
MIILMAVNTLFLLVVSSNLYHPPWYFSMTAKSLFHYHTKGDQQQENKLNVFQKVSSLYVPGNTVDSPALFSFYSPQLLDHGHAT